jgi:hypothetical protein
MRLDHFCATNRVSDKTRMDTLMNAITNSKELAMIQLGINCSSSYDTIKRNLITRYGFGWASWMKKTFGFPAAC